MVDDSRRFDDHRVAPTAARTAYWRCSAYSLGGLERDDSRLGIISYVIANTPALDMRVLSCRSWEISRWDAPRYAAVVRPCRASGDGAVDLRFVLRAERARRAIERAVIGGEAFCFDRIECCGRRSALEPMRAAGRADRRRRRCSYRRLHVELARAAWTCAACSRGPRLFIGDSAGCRIAPARERDPSSARSRYPKIGSPRSSRVASRQCDCERASPRTRMND